jgi:hypothetical protein
MSSILSDQTKPNAASTNGEDPPCRVAVLIYQIHQYPIGELQ